MKRLAFLRSRPAFARLWAGQMVSLLGTWMGALGLLAVVYLHASPAQVGVLAAAAGAPVLLLSLPAGVWVDRLPRRPLLVAADVARFAVLLTLPLLALAERLAIAHVYAAAALAGACGVVFELAHRSYLPAVVGRDELVEANGLLEAGGSASEVIAPAAGGALVQAASAPFAVLVDALTFLVSAAFVASIAGPEERPAMGEGRRLLQEVGEGLSVVARVPLLRTIALASATFSFFGGMIGALYLLFGIRELSLSPAAVGAIIGVGGLGSLFGALLAGAAARAVGLGPAIIISRVVTGCLTFLIPLAGGPPAMAAAFLIAGQLLGDPFWVVYEIGQMSLRQSITPDRLLGRVNATFHLIVAGGAPLGGLAGGALAELVGVREALFVAASGSLAGCLWLLFSPLWSLRAARAGEAAEQ